MEQSSEKVRFLSDEERHKYLTLKEAATLTEYTPDYIGQLIRAGKIKGEQVYTSVSWVTTEKAVRDYMESKGKSEQAHEREHSLRTVHDYMRITLYGVIGCLVCFLLILVYILSVGVDRAMTQSSLKAFEARMYAF
jgi:hypothetical protein